MREFLEPRLEVLQFYAEEILTSSSTTEAVKIPGIETPDKPIG